MHKSYIFKGSTVKRKRNNNITNDNNETSKSVIATDVIEDEKTQTQAKGSDNNIIGLKKKRKVEHEEESASDKQDETEEPEEKTIKRQKQGKQKEAKEKTRKIVYSIKLNTEKFDKPNDEDVALRAFILEKAKEVSSKPDKKEGKKAGEKVTYEYKKVNITIRLDKLNKRVNPRVSFGEHNDPTTQYLSEMLNNKSSEYKKLFLRALRGDNCLEKEKTNKAYTDGIGTRATVLISNAIDHPGENLTSHLLGKATERNYKTLFIGGKHEKSIGSIPSQQQSQPYEDPHERTSAYNKIGALMKKGTGNTTSAPSNLSYLRKVKSIMETDPSIVTIKTGEEELKAEEVIQFVSRESILGKRKNYNKKFPGFFVHSPPQTNSDEEAEKIELFSRCVSDCAPNEDDFVPIAQPENALTPWSGGDVD